MQNFIPFSEAKIKTMLDGVLLKQKSTWLVIINFFKNYQKSIGLIKLKYSLRFQHEDIKNHNQCIINN